MLYSAVENTLYVTTPAVSETTDPPGLPIIIELYDGSRININHAFEYRCNPNITDMQPRSHLAV